MNIYKVERTDRVDYDEFHGAVVVARSRTEAVTLNPEIGSSYSGIDEPTPRWPSEWQPEHLKVTLLGRAKAGSQPHVVMADYHAG